MLSVGVFAQKFQFGLKAGANLSNFTGLSWDDVDTKPILGFHGGAFLNLLFGDHFMLSPEALFSTQGAKFETVGEEDQDYKVSYLAVPVLLRYRFNGGFYVEAGPQVSFKLSENIDNQSGRKFCKRSYDLAIDAGIGWHSNSGFGIGARYVSWYFKSGRL